MKGLKSILFVLLATCMAFSVLSCSDDSDKLSGSSSSISSLPENFLGNYEEEENYQESGRLINFKRELEVKESSLSLKVSFLNCTQIPTADNGWNNSIIPFDDLSTSTKERIREHEFEHNVSVVSVEEDPLYPNTAFFVTIDNNTVLRISINLERPNNIYISDEESTFTNSNAEQIYFRV